MNLYESYKTRLAVSESVYNKAHAGAVMDNNRKLTVATCLDNVNKFLNEAFDSSMGTQRADLGEFKKFCLNLTTVALPNLIAHDLVMVHPMSSMSGNVAYIKYVAGAAKGATKVGDVFNDPFRLGAVDADYTGERVVETSKATAGQTAFALGWKAEIKDGKLVDGRVLVNGTLVEHSAAEAQGVVTVTIAACTLNDEVKIAYVYNNIVVPQAKLPMLKAEMANIPLLAKARRIAVYYSQIAAFQAKTDYGFDLGDQLAEKAVGQLSYEIDTEVVQLLDETAGAAKAALTWSKTLPVGVSKAEHYEGFSEIVEIGRQLIYDATKRFAPNYMIIASNILPVLTFMKGFSAAPASNINGPYLAGTLNGLKVFVSPAIAAGRFVMGVNGDDFMSSAAVYAPYMAIVPTQLMQYADGGTTQGWSTMYDLKVLNADLVVAGEVAA